MFLEDLIRFFLQNFVLFLVVLFGLSRLFQRIISSQEDKKTFAPSPLPPVVKPFFDELDEEIERKPKQTQTVQMRDGKLDTIEMEKGENTSRGGLAGNFHENQSAFRLSKNELHNAVIWSEILGPPRAYKKHSIRHSTCR